MTTIRLEPPLQKLRSKPPASFRSGSAKISKNHRQCTYLRLATLRASASGVPHSHYVNVRRSVPPELSPPQSNAPRPRSLRSNLRAPLLVSPFYTLAQRAPTAPTLLPSN